MLCLAGFPLLEGKCFKRSVFTFSTNKVKTLASFRKRFLHILLVSKCNDLCFPVPQIKSSCLVIYLNIFYKCLRSSASGKTGVHTFLKITVLLWILTVLAIFYFLHVIKRACISIFSFGKCFMSISFSIVCNIHIFALFANYKLKTRWSGRGIPDNIYVYSVHGCM